MVRPMDQHLCNLGYSGCISHRLLDIIYFTLNSIQQAAEDWFCRHNNYTQNVDGNHQKNGWISHSDTDGAKNTGSAYAVAIVVAN